MTKIPRAYHITFRSYGTWLPGDERGYITSRNNRFGKPYKSPSKNLAARMQQSCKNQAYQLDFQSRTIVLDTLVQQCELQTWKLFAGHVRSNHAHLIVSAPISPEQLLLHFKRYCSKALNENSGEHRSRWARHGSTQ